MKPVDEPSENDMGTSKLATDRDTKGRVIGYQQSEDDLFTTLRHGGRDEIREGDYGLQDKAGTPAHTFERDISKQACPSDPYWYLGQEPQNTGGGGPSSTSGQIESSIITGESFFGCEAPCNQT